MQSNTEPSTGTNQVSQSTERLMDDLRQTIDRQRQRNQQLEELVEELTTQWNDMTIEYENRLAALRGLVLNLQVQNTALASLVNERGHTITQMKGRLRKEMERDAEKGIDL